MADLETKKFGNALFIKYSGDMEKDLETITAKNIKDIVTAETPQIVLDMEKVSKLYSASISRLVEILKTVENKNGHLYLVNLSSHIIKVLSMVNIIGKFNIYNSDYEFIQDQTETKYGKEKPVTNECSIHIDKTGDKAYFKIDGPLVEDRNGILLINNIEKELEDDSTNKIEIDFANTKFVDSLNVGNLLNLFSQCESKNKEIKIVNINNNVKEILKANDAYKLIES